MEEDIQQRLIEHEMKESYVDYAMSVIMARALPDVRDGLKPVHRRILYAMTRLGLQSSKPFRKCAFIVGRVLAEFHPHGDTAVYDALARMAQDFSLRYPLVFGQGNFGNVDGDKPAHQRYTEAKLKKLGEELLADIDKETVDFVPNYDNSSKEPVVLPTRIPNLLVNGSTGIAVGMATNIPPHNMGEIIDACIALIGNPKIELNELLQHVKGPDFPTGGIITGKTGIVNAYKHGRGKVIVKARTTIEDGKIIITEIPYMVNKSLLLESMVNLIKNKIVDDIADIRDESSRKGMRIVIKLKKGSNPDVTLNQLFKHTPLRTTFGVIMLTLYEGQPIVMGLHKLLQCFIDHRKDVVVRRTQFDLRKAEERQHIVLGLNTALEHIDPIVQLLKKAENTEVAKTGLQKQYKLSDKQAQAILEMRLQKLTSLETKKLKEEYEELTKLITELKSILDDEKKIFTIIKDELLEEKKKFADERKTEILEGEEQDFVDEDLIKEEDVVVTMSHAGYMKQLPLTTYRKQRRGGTGVKGAVAKDEDVIEQIFVTSNLNYLLFFTNLGRVHWLKAYKVPEGSRYARGKAVVNLLRMKKDEKVNTVLPLNKFSEQQYLMFVTRKGVLKKTELSAFANPRKGGILGINLREGDELERVLVSDGSSQIILGTKNGLAVRCDEQDIRPMGRTASGVRGVRLIGRDEVIGMERAMENAFVLTVTENGFGKRTKVGDYRLIKRGGKGVISIKTSERNGKVVAMKIVTPDDELIFMTKQGVVLRAAAKDVSEVGRNTQGVRLMRLRQGDRVMSVAVIKQKE